MCGCQFLWLAVPYFKSDINSINIINFIAPSAGNNIMKIFGTVIPA